MNLLNGPTLSRPGQIKRDPQINPTGGIYVRHPFSDGFLKKALLEFLGLDLFMAAGLRGVLLLKGSEREGEK